MKKRNSPNLRFAIDYYFSLCENATNLKTKVKSLDRIDWIDIKHESLIDNTKYWLTILCEFLGQYPLDNWLDDCASIVFKSPRKTRYELVWSSEIINRIKKGIEKYPFLSGYDYEH